MAVSEGMGDVYVALGQLRRTKRADSPSPRPSGGGKTGKALVAALMGINPDRVKRGQPTT